MFRDFIEFLWEITKIIIIALLIVVPIRYFVFQPFLVKGQSMEPNFQNGDYLIIDEVSYLLQSPKRGEVIVFRYPDNPSQRYIKRVIGLPGETVEVRGGKVIIYNPALAETSQVLDESYYLPEDIQTPGSLRMTLAENEYFVLGDNRFVSSDSRRWGALPEGNIIGRAVLKLWPLASVSAIELPSY